MFVDSVWQTPFRRTVPFGQHTPPVEYVPAGHPDGGGTTGGWQWGLPVALPFWQTVLGVPLSGQPPPFGLFALQPVSRGFLHAGRFGLSIQALAPPVLEPLPPLPLFFPWFTRRFAPFLECFLLVLFAPLVELRDWLAE